MNSAQKYLLLTIMVLLVSGCHNPKGPIFLGDPEPPTLTEEEKRCIEVFPDEHRNMDLISAAERIEKSKRFGQLLQQLEVLDPVAFISLSKVGNGQFTILMPIDEAFEKFFQSYGQDFLQGDTLETFLKQHILIERFAFRDIIRGIRAAPNMNDERVTFSKNLLDCMTVNGDAVFVQVEDICKNGFIHVIDQILIPDEGY